MFCWSSRFNHHDHDRVSIESKPRPEYMIDVDLLERRVLQVEDFDEAMDALEMLATVGQSRALHVALKILRDGIDDVLYQASACEVLYDISIPDGVEYVEVNCITVDPCILGSMLTCVAVDVGSVKNRDEFTEGVAALRAALATRATRCICPGAVEMRDAGKQANNYRSKR